MQEVLIWIFAFFPNLKVQNVGGGTKNTFREFLSNSFSRGGGATNHNPKVKVSAVLHLFCKGLCSGHVFDLDQWFSTLEARRYILAAHYKPVELFWSLYLFACFWTLL